MEGALCRNDTHCKTILSPSQKMGPLLYSNAHNYVQGFEEIGTSSRLYVQRVSHLLTCAMQDKEK